MSRSDALIESVSLREAYADRTDVLDRVKKLVLLPDDVNTSMELTAEYYGVPKQTINSLIHDNRDELALDGIRTLTGSELNSLKELGVVGKNSSSFTIIPRRAILRIGMLLRDSLVARSVRDHLLNVENDRSTRYDDPALVQFKKEVFFLEAASEMLRLPDSGRLKLLGDFNKEHGLNVPLPSYADEQVTESATVLLKKHGVSMGTVVFNKLLISYGILEECERPSSKGGKKYYKSLTDAGVTYGKNIISPKEPRESQPHYFANKFTDLLRLVGL
jgi:hypothetical protein